MPIGSTQPFRPAGTVSIAASTTAGAASLSGAGEAALVFNSSGAIAFVRFGTDMTVTAQPTDTPVPAGARMLIHVGELAATVSVRLMSGSGTVYVSRGDGTVY